VAIRAMPVIGEHCPLQSLVVARAAGVRGKNDIRTAYILCAPNDAGRYGPIVGGVELLPDGSTTGGHHASIGKEVPVESIICTTGWLLRSRRDFASGVKARIADTAER